MQGSAGTATSYLLALLLCVGALQPETGHATTTGQATSVPEWHEISTARGDLNGDGRPDVATVAVNEVAAKATDQKTVGGLGYYRLMLRLTEPGGGSRLVLTNDAFLAPPDPNGTNDDPLESDAVRIDRGSLVINRNFLRGHYSYRFRWSQGSLKLIGYDFIGSDGRCISEISVNYLTRKVSIETEALGEGAEVRRFSRRIKRGPVTIEEASSADFHPLRDMVGPPTYCIFEGQRV